MASIRYPLMKQFINIFAVVGRVTKLLQTESSISYALYRVRNSDALKRFARAKSVISYALYRVRNGDALKRSAPSKSSISYLRYRVRNYIIDAIFYSTNNSCLILIEQANIIILEIC